MSLSDTQLVRVFGVASLGLAFGFWFAGWLKKWFDARTVRLADLQVGDVRGYVAGGRVWRARIDKIYSLENARGTAREVYVEHKVWSSDSTEDNALSRTESATTFAGVFDKRFERCGDSALHAYRAPWPGSEPYVGVGVGAFAKAVRAAEAKAAAAPKAKAEKPS